MTFLEFLPQFIETFCPKDFQKYHQWEKKGEVLETVKRCSAAVILSVAAVEESREAACLWLVSSLALIRRLLLRL